MKLLLDENLPKRLKEDLKEYEIYTVRDMGWNGKQNGELLALMIGQRFDVLLTFDRNLQFQQNFKKYSLPVLVLNSKDNTYLNLKSLVPQIKRCLSRPLIAGASVIE